jgi:class 3 adenylate cyclase
VRAGALTFLFTDIEASTRRWETDAAAMSAALARHDATARHAVTAAGGRIFKHTGDGVCAVFGSSAAGPLRVRMALHSGEVEERDDDYFGPTLNRTARLMAAAWGGQMLVSAATAELGGHGLPPGSRLVDLGVHRPADLSRPEHIFQLTGHGSHHLLRLHRARQRRPALVGAGAGHGSS